MGSHNNEIAMLSAAAGLCADQPGIPAGTCFQVEGLNLAAAEVAAASRPAGLKTHNPAAQHKL